MSDLFVLCLALRVVYKEIFSHWQFGLSYTLAWNERGGGDKVVALVTLFCILRFLAILGILAFPGILEIHRSLGILAFLRFLEIHRSLGLFHRYPNCQPLFRLQLSEADLLLDRIQGIFIRQRTQPWNIVLIMRLSYPVAVLLEETEALEEADDGHVSAVQCSDDPAVVRADRFAHEEEAIVGRGTRERGIEVLELPWSEFAICA